ncbi:30S ribosomal protein S6e [Candidatus Pacearchaeota archaeon]|nr:30S ribosomal protein S6e [Candidatus Pacearchaeota archaeon]
MVFKLNMSHNGRAWKLEVEGDVLSGKSIGDKIDGGVLKPELKDYELKITGGSDIAGFPMFSGVEGTGLNKKLFTKGWGFTTRSKNGKLPRGIRKKKSIRGRTISEAIAQVNLKVLKEGSKKLEEIFPEQNQPKAKETPVEAVPAAKES